MKIIISGLNGSMGKCMVESSKEKDYIEIVGGVSKSSIENNNYNFEVQSEYCNLSLSADIVIDFSHTDNTEKLLEYGVKTQTPLLIATTGHSEAQLNMIKKASDNIPILLSSNTSFGINMLEKMLTEYAKYFAEDYDIEIIEKHHNKKIDAPSGTAKTLIKAIENSREFAFDKKYGRTPEDGRRKDSEMGVHSIRGGTYVGEHQIIFAGKDEIIEFSHKSLSNKIFAEGALKAALKLIELPNGYYEMKSIY